MKKKIIKIFVIWRTACVQPSDNFVMITLIGAYIHGFFQYVFSAHDGNYVSEIRIRYCISMYFWCCILFYYHCFVIK